VRITTWAEYGLICALHLARRDEEGPVTGREIAARERLPGDYVEQILLRLRRAEIVRSQRGARGGYLLARAAADISVREVIQASELETFDLHCATNPVEERAARRRTRAASARCGRCCSARSTTCSRACASPTCCTRSRGARAGGAVHGAGGAGRGRAAALHAGAVDLALGAEARGLPILHG
jgi:Rrf2 family protein